MQSETEKELHGHMKTFSAVVWDYDEIESNTILIISFQSFIALMYENW